ncbi:MAG: hypothetical protein KDB80_05090 [Planctomycetes bacterium]|nr:hypothetical protein [Planctomycetota bacterium]
MMDLTWKLVSDGTIDGLSESDDEAATIPAEPNPQPKSRLDAAKATDTRVGAEFMRERAARGS